MDFSGRRPPHLHAPILSLVASCEGMLDFACLKKSRHPLCVCLMTSLLALCGRACTCLSCAGVQSFNIELEF